MINNFTLLIARFLLLVLFQTIILNNINFSGYLNPYLYIYFILLLPFDFPKWIMLVSAFLLGMSIDIFTNTMGLHMTASVLIAFTRPGIIRILTKQTQEPGQTPSINEMGFKWFLYYVIILTIIHHSCIFFLEVFRFSEIWDTLMKVVFSTAFTVVLIIITQFLFTRSKK